MKDRNIKILLNISAVLLSVIFVILLLPFIFAYFNEDPQNIQEIVETCNGGNISETSSCVVKITSRFYKYNEENIGKNLTFDELKEEGGVCSSWSNYYGEIGGNLGYNAKN